MPQVIHADQNGRTQPPLSKSIASTTSNAFCRQSRHQYALVKLPLAAEEHYCFAVQYNVVSLKHASG